MRIPYSALMASLTFALTLSACSPSQNWREVALEGTTLKVQLPCKPDRTTRAVPLGGVFVALQVVGCESGSAIVVVMTASLTVGADVHAALAGWQKATLANARVPQPLATEQQQSWHPPKYLPLSASKRIQAKGLRPDGEAVMIEAVWGAVAEGDHVRLVHAVVYDRQILPEMVNTLFEGLKP